MMGADYSGKRLRLQRGMRSIAEGLTAGVLAIAKRHGARFGEGKFYGSEAGALVGAVAIGLSL
jgi:hypothetical protein